MKEDESFDKFYAKLKDTVTSTFNLGETILEPKICEKGAQIFTREISCQDHRD